MKKIVLVLVVLLVNWSVLLAQMTAPTTEAEYNYGAVGYKIQLQAKLETKEGYTLKDAEGCEESERKIEFKIMPLPIALIMAGTLVISLFVLLLPTLLVKKISPIRAIRFS